MDSDRVFEGEKKRPKGLFYVITFSILNNNKSISEIIERNIVEKRLKRQSPDKFYLKFRYETSLFLSNVLKNLIAFQLKDSVILLFVKLLSYFQLSIALCH